MEWINVIVRTVRTILKIFSKKESERYGLHYSGSCIVQLQGTVNTIIVMW